jgi:hypothetical protein
MKACTTKRRRKTMTLRKFKDVTRNIKGPRKSLREDIVDAEISDVKVIATPGNSPSVEREIALAEFIDWIGSKNDDENIILTGISF